MSLVDETVKLPMLKISDYQANVLKYILQQPTPVNIQYAMKQVNKSFQNATNKNKQYNREYIRMLRLLKKLQQHHLIELFKMDGLIWVKPTTPTLLDLIEGAMQNSNSVKQKPKSTLIPRRCSGYRKDAIEVALSRQMLDETRIKRIEHEFEMYLSAVKHKRIVLKRYSDAPTFYSQFLILNYKTRFTDKQYIRKQVKNVDEFFKKANFSFKNAVLLTLTTDPKRFKSAFHSWRNFSKAFNRFMSFLKKRLKFRPIYISFFEFTKSGLLHVHTIFFNVAYLLSKQDIVDEWKRCGQGEIVDIVALQNTSGRWHSLGEVAEAKRKIGNVKGYLMKYVKKALLQHEGLSLYFVSNKRFISWSYRFYRPDPDRKESLGVFYFFCSCFIWDIPLVVNLSESEAVKWANCFSYDFNFL